MNWFMIIPLIVASVTKNSVKIECAIIVICLVTFFPVFFTICLDTSVTCLLKHWEIAKVIFLVYQIMKKTTFLSRNRSSLTKEGRKINVKRELRFIDSLRFMASSLDKRSSNLKIDQFVNLQKYYSGNQLSLLLRKGVNPYDYVDCMKKLDETSLPPKEAFYSILTCEGITDEDYQHAQRIWKEFNTE